VRGERRGSTENAPASFAQLATLLQARQATLTPSHRAVAERVLNDPEGIAFMTVAELAAVVGVNESTVIRFANSLGLDGFPAMVRLCQERLREQAQMLRRFETPANQPDDVSEIRAGMAGLDQANISRSFARIDPEDWDTAVTALVDAPAVHVLGLRKCYPAAYLLGHTLQLLREDVTVLSQGAGTLADQLRGVHKGHVFVGLSIHRYTADTVRAFIKAHEGGATTIALTDSPASPLASSADVAMYLDTGSMSVLRSVTAFVSVVQALAADVAARGGTRTRSALLTEESVLDEFNVYY
jgi:DNA-binding MurR/RpiR family transcriptional regulator